MRETVTATLKVTMNVSENVSGEVSNGPSLRAFDSVHRADHEMTMGDVVNVQVSSRQTFHQHVRSPPPALP
jgi:hypothetical protein